MEIDWNSVTDFFRKKPVRFKAVQLENGDWAVLDIETGKTVILTDDVFSMVFEKHDMF